ncbi:MAG TPA: MCE family protein, partial [Deltaproteobacteria bacterium]|nr:MCE family protein [Deltaproteobacteria bacterium]
MRSRRTMAEERSGESSGGAEELPGVIVRDRARISIVWLVPIVAAIVGLYLAYWAWSEKGPTITITFASAEGLEAGKTKVKYKKVEVGLVESVRLTDDLSRVEVEVSMAAGMAPHLTDKTRFWIVRAQVSAGQITGLETVLSGVYIAMDPSDEGRRTREFVGLEKAPVVTSDKPGTLFKLRARELGTIEVGSPVYYRWIKVGQVAGYELSESGQDVSIQVFIEAPNDQRVRTTTRFWNASGFDVTVTTEGIEVDTPSLISMLVGGVAFETPATVTVARDVPEDMVFELYPNKQATRRPLFSQKSRFLLYFKESVAGLSPGAPVEFRGIRIGEVLTVEVKFDPKTREMSIPVVIEIEPERFGISEEDTGDAELESLRSLVARGFRARVVTNNLLTGKKAVEFDLLENAEPAEIVMGEAYPVLPTTAGGLDVITDRVARIVAKVDGLPIESIGRNLEEVLRSLSVTLGEMEALTGAANRDLVPGLSASLGKL